MGQNIANLIEQLRNDLSGLSPELGQELARFYMQRYFPKYKRTIEQTISTHLHPLQLLKETNLRLNHLSALHLEKTLNDHQNILPRLNCMLDTYIHTRSSALISQTALADPIFQQKIYGTSNPFSEDEITSVSLNVRKYVFQLCLLDAISYQLEEVIAGKQQASNALDKDVILSKAKELAKHYMLDSSFYVIELMLLIERDALLSYTHFRDTHTNTPNTNLASTWEQGPEREWIHSIKPYHDKNIDRLRLKATEHLKSWLSPNQTDKFFLKDLSTDEIDERLNIFIEKRGNTHVMSSETETSEKEGSNDVRQNQDGQSSGHYHYQVTDKNGNNVELNVGKTSEYLVPQSSLEPILEDLPVEYSLPMSTRLKNELNEVDAFLETVNPILEECLTEDREEDTSQHNIWISGRDPSLSQKIAAYQQTVQSKDPALVQLKAILNQYQFCLDKPAPSICCKKSENQRKKEKLIQTMLDLIQKNSSLTTDLNELLTKCIRELKDLSPSWCERSLNWKIESILHPDFLHTVGNFFLSNNNPARVAPAPQQELSVDGDAGIGLQTKRR